MMLKKHTKNVFCGGRIKGKVKLISLMIFALAFMLWGGVQSTLCVVPSHTHAETVDGIIWYYNVLPGDTVEIAGVAGDNGHGGATLLPTANITIPNTLPVNGVQRKVTAIGRAAFAKVSLFNQDSIKSVIIPDTVTSIGDRAFEGIDLTSITIPNKVKSIGNSAFRDCKSLTSVDMGNSVETIDALAFYNCNQLTSIDIPDSVTTLGAQMFRYCSALDSVTLGENVRAINDYTFCDCTNLESINIPKSVSTVRRAAFYNCQKLTSITIPCDFNKSAFNGDQFFTVSGDEYTITCRNPVGTRSGTFSYTHVYGEPDYTWNYDETENKWTCSAERICAASADAREAEDGVVTDAVTKEPTCIDMGETTYTATFTKPNFLTQTKTVADIPIDPDAHDWETVWLSDDNEHWHKCSLCQMVTDRAEHTWTVEAKTDKETKYICDVCARERIEQIIPPPSPDEDDEDDEDEKSHESSAGSSIWYPKTGDFSNVSMFLFNACSSLAIAWFSHKKPKNLK